MLIIPMMWVANGLLCKHYPLLAIQPCPMWLDPMLRYQYLTFLPTMLDEQSYPFECAPCIASLPPPQRLL